MHRRHLLKLAATASLAPWLGTFADSRSPSMRLQALESTFNGRLGACALDVATARQLVWRGEERFPVCSTFKAVLAAAVLQRVGAAKGLRRRVRYGEADLVSYSPITEKYLTTGMTVGELCAAALQYSDNTAGNLLLREVGGPAGLTAFARGLGDEHFRLDRWETELNTAIPQDPRDTSTPAAMAATLQRLLLGAALAAPERAQLKAWMLANTTGAARIRAGVPAGWAVADKTGTGAYASASDIGVVWMRQDSPIVMAIYTTQPGSDTAAPRNDLIAEATRIIVNWARS